MVFRRKSRAPAAQAPPTVLLVDDVETIRALLRAHLEPEFTVVGEAGDGAEAQRQAEALRPDAVVLDLNMPRHDGLEAIAPILRVSPETRIVVLSVLAREVIEDKVLGLGADAFVDKSDSLDAVVAALRAVLA